MSSRVRSPATATVLAAAASAILLCVLALAGCGAGRPGTPEALYEEFARLNAAGETGKMWDLLTPDRQRRFRETIDGYRAILARNDDPNEKTTAQFNCTREEFKRLPYVELFVRENLGRRRALVDAKIREHHPDVRRPGTEELIVQTPPGTRVHFWMKPMDDGWAIEDVQVEP